MGTSDGHLDILFEVLTKNSDLLGLNSKSADRRTEEEEKDCVDYALSRANLAMSPQEAFFSDFEYVSLDEAKNRVSAALVVPYPPGIPLIAPGMSISASAIATIKETLADEGASSIHGLGEGPSIKVVRGDPRDAVSNPLCLEMKEDSDVHQVDSGVLTNQKAKDLIKRQINRLNSICGGKSSASDNCPTV